MEKWKDLGQLWVASLDSNSESRGIEKRDVNLEARHVKDSSSKQGLCTQTCRLDSWLATHQLWEQGHLMQSQSLCSWLGSGNGKNNIKNRKMIREAPIEQPQMLRD